VTTLEFSQSNYLMIVGVLSANRKLSRNGLRGDRPSVLYCT
jgi:hypothetical protein